MPQVRLTEQARADLVRLREFLRTRNPPAARRMGQLLSAALERLAEHPEVGRPVEDLEHGRELIIPFGDSGYLMLYRYVEDEPVLVLAIRHQREAGYLH